MWAVAKKSYYDKQKMRDVGVGEELLVDEERFKELEKAGLIEKKAEKKEEVAPEQPEEKKQAADKKETK